MRPGSTAEGENGRAFRRGGPQTQKACGLRMPYLSVRCSVTLHAKISDAFYGLFNKQQSSDENPEP